MIFCEYASPIPGSACSWSFVAELMSSKSAAADALIAVPAAGVFLVWAGRKVEQQRIIRAANGIVQRIFMTSLLKRKFHAAGWCRQRGQWPACKLQCDCGRCGFPSNGLHPEKLPS